MGGAIYPLYVEIMEILAVPFTTLILMWLFPKKSPVWIICIGALAGIITEIILGSIVNGIALERLNPLWFINPLRPVLVLFIFLAFVTFKVAKSFMKQ